MSLVGLAQNVAQSAIKRLPFSNRTDEAAPVVTPAAPVASQPTAYPTAVTLPAAGMGSVDQLSLSRYRQQAAARLTEQNSPKSSIAALVTPLLGAGVAALFVGLSMLFKRA
jgi:hypothetical protein